MSFFLSSLCAPFMSGDFTSVPGCILALVSTAFTPSGHVCFDQFGLLRILTRTWADDMTIGPRGNCESGRMEAEGRTSRCTSSLSSLASSEAIFAVCEEKRRDTILSCIAKKRWCQPSASGSTTSVVESATVNSTPSAVVALEGR